MLRSIPRVCHRVQGLVAKFEEGVGIVGVGFRVEGLKYRI